jgi:hypothetical protein
MESASLEGREQRKEQELASNAYNAFTKQFNSQGYGAADITLAVSDRSILRRCGAGADASDAVVGCESLLVGGACVVRSTGGDGVVVPKDRPGRRPSAATMPHVCCGGDCGDELGTRILCQPRYSQHRFLHKVDVPALQEVQSSSVQRGRACSEQVLSLVRSA